MLNRKQRFYLTVTVLLLITEVLIALFVHDRFIRPYVGDVLVVILLYSFIRIFIPDRVVYLSLYIFGFAVLVELLQLFSFVNWVGLENSRFFRILIGSVFDWADIICYFAGTVFTSLWEYLRIRSMKKEG